MESLSQFSKSSNNSDYIQLGKHLQQLKISEDGSSAYQATSSRTSHRGMVRDPLP